jgi:hypothetical protein
MFGAHTKPAAQCSVQRKSSGLGMAAILGAVAQFINMKSWLFLCVFATAAIFYNQRAFSASPCEGLHGGVSSADKNASILASSKQTRSTRVEVLDDFRSHDWIMLYLETHVSDEPVVFLHKKENTLNFVALWAGGAIIGQEAALEEWAHRDVPGIPTDLARCFAWYVTYGRKR